MIIVAVTVYLLHVGLETMHLMTQAKNYELRVDMEDFEGQKVFAEYSSFSVGPESDGYKLNLGRFVRGAAGGMFFQTVRQSQYFVLWLCCCRANYLTLISVFCCCFFIRRLSKSSQWKEIHHY